jgi:hypothetical protein
MMLDADVVAVSPSSVYRVLKRAGWLDRKWQKPSKKGTGFQQPLAAHDHCQSAVAFQRILIVIVKNGLLLPVGQPAIARHAAVVLILPAVAVFPLVELAASQPLPAEQRFGRKPAALGPVLDVVDDGVARIVRNPFLFQSPPLTFFSRTLPSISSEITSFFCASFVSRCAILRSFALLRAGQPAGLALEGPGAVLKELRLPLVDLAGLQAMSVAQVRDGHLLNQVPLHNRQLLRRAPRLTLLTHRNLQAKGLC